MCEKQGGGHRTFQAHICYSKYKWGGTPHNPKDISVLRLVKMWGGHHTFVIQSTNGGGTPHNPNDVCPAGGRVGGFSGQ